MIPKFVYCVFYSEEHYTLDIFAMAVLKGEHTSHSGWELKVDRDCIFSNSLDKTPWITECVDMYRWHSCNGCEYYYTIDKEDAINEFHKYMESLSTKIIGLQNEALEISKSMVLAYKRKAEMDKLLEWCNKLEEE